MNSFPSFARRFRTGPISVGLLAVCLTAESAANTISQTLGFRLNADNSTEVVHFDAFNTALGNLIGVEVSYSATRRHDWALWNTARPVGSARDITYTASLQGSTLSLGGTVQTIADAHYGPATVTGLTAVSAATAFGAFNSARTQFLGGFTPAFAGGFTPGTDLETVSGTLLLPSFDGDLVFSFDPGSLNLAYFEGVWAVAAAGPFSAGSLVDIAGVATVTYTYRVTESGTGWPISLGLAVFALGVSRRRAARGLFLP